MKPTILTLAAFLALAVTAGSADAQPRPAPIMVHPTVSGSPYANGYVPFNLGAYNYYNPMPTYNYGYSYNYSSGYSTGYNNGYVAPVPTYNYGSGYRYNYSQSYYNTWPGAYGFPIR